MEKITHTRFGKNNEKITKFGKNNDTQVCLFAIAFIGFLALKIQKNINKKLIKNINNKDKKN